MIIHSITCQDITLTIDWERRRRNIRILMAAKALKPSPAADAAGVSVNVVSQFLNGTTQRMAEKTLEKLCPVLGIVEAADLDTDNPLDDPRSTLRKMLKDVPTDRLPELIQVLRSRFPELGN